MGIEQRAQPSSKLNIEADGQTVIDFGKLERQQEEIKRLNLKYPDSKVNFSSIVPDGNGNFILEGTQKMTSGELEEYISKIAPGNDEALEKERIETAHKYHIFNPEELEKREDGKWYFHGIEVEKDAETMSGNDADDLYGKYKNVDNDESYVSNVEINPIPKKQEISKSKSKYKSRNKPLRTFDPYK